MISNIPRVSVCIPVYNPGEFLKPAIKSVLAQSEPGFEVLIIDDHSSQPVNEIIKNCPDSRLIYFQNTHNLGLVGNWNRCIELAQGEYITILHQDDLMYKDNLRRKVEALRANPGAGFVYSDQKTIDESGQIVGGHWLPQPTEDMTLSGRELFKMVAFSGNVISCPSVMVRRECYEQLGTFNEDLPFAVDLEMWLRISKHFDVVYIAEALIAHRVHPNQVTARFQGTGKDYLDVLRAFDIFQSGNLPNDYRPLVKQAYRTLGTQASSMARWKFRNGQIRNGLQYSFVSLLSLERSSRLK